MKANKITLNIKVEVLSIDAAPHLIAQVIEQIQREYVNGQLGADDGDTVTWTTKQEPVNI